MENSLACVFREVVVCKTRAAGHGQFLSASPNLVSGRLAAPDPGERGALSYVTLWSWPPVRYTFSLAWVLPMRGVCKVLFFSSFFFEGGGSPGGHGAVERERE